MRTRYGSDPGVEPEPAVGEGFLDDPGGEQRRSRPAPRRAAGGVEDQVLDQQVQISDPHPQNLILVLLPGRLRFLSDTPRPGRGNRRRGRGLPLLRRLLLPADRVIGVGDAKILDDELLDQDGLRGGFLLRRPGPPGRSGGRRRARGNRGTEGFYVHLPVRVLDDIDLPAGENHLLHRQRGVVERSEIDLDLHFRDQEKFSFPEALRLGDPQVPDRDPSPGQSQAERSDGGPRAEEDREFQVGDPHRRCRQEKANDHRQDDQGKDNEPWDFY